MTTPTRIAFVDVETTGTDPDRHELWEIGLVLRENGTDREYAWQIVPNMFTAEPAALRIGGYYERCDFASDPAGTSACTAHPDGLVGGEHDAMSDDPARTAGLVAYLLNEAILVAANVAFDASFLDRFLRRNSHAPAWNYHLLEIESYAAGALGMEPPWKLDGFLSAFDIKMPEGQRHTALGDALAVRDLYDACRNPEALSAARGPRA